MMAMARRITPGRPTSPSSSRRWQRASTCSRTASPRGSRRRRRSASRFRRPSPSRNGAGRAGSGRCRNGVKPGECFAVIMIGRLDDYLREVAADNRAPVSESDIRQSGLAVDQARVPDLQGARVRGRAARGGAARRLPPDGTGGRGPHHVDCPGSPGVVRDRRPSLRGTHREGHRRRRRAPARLDARIHRRPTNRTAWRRATSSPTDRRSARCASSSRRAGS